MAHIRIRSQTTFLSGIGMGKKISDDGKPVESNIVSIEGKKPAKTIEKRSKLSLHLEKRRQSPPPPTKK